MGSSRTSRGPAGGAIVTGGAGGLGRALGAMLVARGYRVWLADVDAEAAGSAARALGPAAAPAGLDVTDAAAAVALAHEVHAAAGLAVWVNNAGVLRCGPAWSHPAGDVETMFAVNVRGTINGTLAALEVMRATGHGHIVNIISLAGLIAPPGETVYAATKHAALAYTLGTAQDLRQQGIAGVHVSAVCPDGMWTPMLQALVHDPDAAPSWSGKLVSPERVAQRVGAVLERPRPLVSVPRWRGGLARAYAALPSLALRVAPQFITSARRKQVAFAAAVRRRDARSGGRPVRQSRGR